ncbi:MAG: ATP-dependent helicase [Anaerolineaceae bacterium]|nr:ATP-dependent helicase [Anaerolineaceae bacterium]
MAEIRLRPSQENILAFTGGRMGISAVPGAGKTFTLSLLAARLLASRALGPEQEVLIVTLVNSAVDNFAARISGLIRQTRLMPNFGYRVRTLHGLAHDIVRERPEAVGLANDFQIVDESEATRILHDVALAYLRSNPDLIESYLKPDLTEVDAQKLRRDRIPDLVESIGLQAIRYAKDQELSADDLRQRLDELPLPLPLAGMGCALYADYQRALNYRGAVDFDDLIRLALQALKTDEQLVLRLRNQWPFILEDEAQDSSHLQEEILNLLAGPGGNWVRVGDPNQAIYETFTTANPEYLLEFRRQPGVRDEDLPESGRSSASIIDLANHLIAWSNTPQAPEALQGALIPPYIQPTAPDDPQPNPPNRPELIYLHEKKLEAAKEIETIAASVKRWLEVEENQQRTVAVLVPRNARGSELAEELKRLGVDVVDTLLKTTTATRQSAGAIANVLRALADPLNGHKLSRAYRSWRGKVEDDSKKVVERAASHLHRMMRTEDYLAPLPGEDYLEKIGLHTTDEPAYHELAAFRESVRRWQAAVLLPIDQLLLTLSQDLFTEPADLAVAHKMAGALRQRTHEHPDWLLPDLIGEIEEIATNKRKFLGFSSDDTNFNPDDYKGRVVIATIHKAKGLEWDRVYLMSANNYDFPSGAPYDTFISEKYFIRDRLNLEAEALDQLRVVVHGDPEDWYEEGHATQRSRIDYARERLRLLYVGVTRARQELVVTWNGGKQGQAVPATPFVELINFWESLHGHR